MAEIRFADDSFGEAKPSPCYWSSCSCVTLWGSWGKLGPEQITGRETVHANRCYTAFKDRKKHKEWVEEAALKVQYSSAIQAAWERQEQSTERAEKKCTSAWLMLNVEEAINNWLASCWQGGKSREKPQWRMSHWTLEVHASEKEN